MLSAAALAAGGAWAAEKQAAPASPPISEATQACLDCHSLATPGIVADWKKSRMAKRTPAMGLKAPEMERRITAKAADIPREWLDVAVGCAECHTLRAEKHPATFDHEGFQVHTVVSPEDCATCHTQERREFGQNLMAHARGNLINNPVYMDLADHVNAVVKVTGGKAAYLKPTPGDEAESCLYCHGTEIKADGQRVINNPAMGEVTVTKLSGWPNRGVGRKNPDGSLGSCTACHTRHQFSIAMARKPAACAECHKGPDVPAYKVYEVSEHGGIYRAMGGTWDFQALPWTVGRDFSAPTCAACHVSLLVSADGAVLAKRSHRMNDRLWVRLIGLIYSHPHPKDPDTSKIKNAEGRSLATALDGRPAASYLIDEKEQEARRETMSKVCLACHGTQWVDGQLRERLTASTAAADAMVLAATRTMQEAWRKGLATGPAKGGSPFDEYIEQLWTEQWLFHANSMRMASAMMGADMGVFESGRWNLHKNLSHMRDWLQTRQDPAR
ncbi:hydroxylamine oxidase [Desulfocarbo indianensis]|nr:hydroxylamine oxidase [Desulfocarbo indianensis]